VTFWLRTSNNREPPQSRHRKEPRRGDASGFLGLASFRLVWPGGRVSGMGGAVRSRLIASTVDESLRSINHSTVQARHKMSRLQAARRVRRVMAFGVTAAGHWFDRITGACMWCGMPRKKFEDDNRPRCTGRLADKRVPLPIFTDDDPPEAA
jgi:hypothetical protein